LQAILTEADAGLSERDREIAELKVRWLLLTALARAANAFIAGEAFRNEFFRSRSCRNA
jgi:hypothetical protein